VVLISGFGILTLVFVHVASLWLEAAILTLAVHLHTTPLKFQPSLVMARGLARDGFLLFLLMMFDLAVRRLDVLILARMTGTYSVGLYVVCARVLEYTAIFRTGTIGALFPFLASRSDKQLTTLANGYNQALRLFTMYAIGLAIPLIFGASKLIHLVFGTEFTPAASVLRILTFSMVANALCGPVAAVIIISRERLSQLAGLVAALSLLTVLLNVLLVPRWAHHGAAIAALVASGAGLLVRRWLVGCILGHLRKSLLPMLYRPAVAGCVSAGCYLLFGDSRFWLAVVPASALYAAVLFLTGAFSNEEMLLMRESIGRLLRLGSS
jgi:O-antigen/teichoic acid export membrane protein